MDKCKIDGCDKKYHGKGLCSVHYYRDYQRKNRDKVNKKNKKW